MRKRTTPLFGKENYGETMLNPAQNDNTGGVAEVTTKSWCVTHGERERWKKDWKCKKVFGMVLFWLGDGERTQG